MNNFAAHFGIKCSSFCKVNVGTSMRSACTSLGFSDYSSVFLSNKLLERIPFSVWLLLQQIIVKWCIIFYWKHSWFHKWMLKTNSSDQSNWLQPVVSCLHSRRRTCTLVVLCTALGGAWSLEQPSGSLLEFYPTWRFILASIFRCGGDRAVISLDVLFYMTHVYQECDNFISRQLASFVTIHIYYIHPFNWSTIVPFH